MFLPDHFRRRRPQAGCAGSDQQEVLHCVPGRHQRNCAVQRRGWNWEIKDQSRDLGSFSMNFRYFFLDRLPI